MKSQLLWSCILFAFVVKNLIFIGAYAITDILEFNTGGSVEDIATSAVAGAIEKKRRKRRKRAATQELLIVEGYIGIVEGYLHCSVKKKLHYSWLDFM